MSRLVFAVMVVISGCIATSAQVDRVEQRVAALEKTNATVMTDVARETKRLENLGKLVEESGEGLREAAAKSQARLADFERAVKLVRGELEVLARRLDQLERGGGANLQAVQDLKQKVNQLVADLRDRAGITILALPAELPPDAAGYAKLAADKFAAGDARVAGAVAAECRKRFPRSEAGAECTLLLGRIAAEEHRWEDAIQLFYDVHNAMEGKVHPLVGEALIEISKALEAQGACGKAVKALKYLQSDFAKLPHARFAKDLVTTAPNRCKEGVGLVPKPGEGPPPLPSEPTPTAAPRVDPHQPAP
jgi:TolA-binding protein